MRQLTTFFLIFSVISVTAYSQTKNTNISTEQTVMQLERKWQKAMETGDSNTKRTLMTDDYMGTIFNGMLRDKPYVMRVPASLAAPTDSAMTVRVHGTTAIVNALWIFKPEGGNLPATYRRRTSVWVQQSNNWKMVASHASTVPIWNVRTLQDSEMETLAPVACTEEQRLKSLNTDVATMIRFRNNTSDTIRIHWINYTGQRHTSPAQIRVIPPGGMLETNTYVTHPFVVVAANGKCYGIYQPSPKAGIAVIQDK